MRVIKHRKLFLQALKRELERVTLLLADDVPLEGSCRDHKLTGNMRRFSVYDI